MFQIINVLCCIGHCFIYFSALLLGISIISHIYTKFKRLPSLKLTNDSYVLIVGACTGIGKLMALNIAQLYHSNIIVIDIRKQLFEGLNQQIKKKKSFCQCFKCDLSDHSQVDKTLQIIKDKYKKIDLLIYNAGVFFPSLSWEAKNKNLITLTNVNYISGAKFITTLLPNLQGGHIAVTASVASIIQGGLYMSSYVASKHAIFGYVSCLRQQLKRHKRNVTISIGCPYAINTGFFEGFKTKLNIILPMLDQKYVAERLVRQFLKRKQVCFIGRRHAFLFKIMSLLPSEIYDQLLIQLDTSDFSKKKNN